MRKRSVVALKTIPWMMLFFTMVSSVSTSAIYFSEEFPFAEFYGAADQLHPYVMFDQNGNIHGVWSDYSLDAGHSYPPYVIHRKLSRSGAVNSQVDVIDNAAHNCDSSACVQDFPMLGMKNSDGTIMAMCSTDISPERYLLSGVYNESLNSWTENIDSVATSEDNSAYFSISTSNINDFLFLAYSNTSVHNDHIELRGANLVTTPPWSWTQSGSITSGIDEFHNVDIAVDADDYIYIVYVRYDGSYYNVVARRSVSPADISSFESERYVGDTLSVVKPSISVMGAYDSSNLYVAVTWSDGLGLINCQVEENGDWTDGLGMGGDMNILNSGGGNVPLNPDSTFGTDGELYVVWQDKDNSNDVINMAVSYDHGLSFLPEQTLTGINDNCTFPRIANFPEKNDLAVVYEKTTGSVKTMYILENLADFRDNGGEIASYWTTAENVTVSSDQDHTGYGDSSLKFAGAEGVLEVDDGSTLNHGTLDFWFFDTMSTEVDFYAEMHGNTTGKAYVYRMLGIRNQTSQTKYSKNISEEKRWSETTFDRSYGWHHVIFTVDSGGIVMRLDPETNPDAVSDAYATEFRSFSRVRFTGGDASSSDAYYLDDVRLQTDECGTLTVPATTPLGILTLVSGFAWLLFRRR